MKNLGTKLQVTDLGGGNYEITVNDATDTFTVASAFSCSDLESCSIDNLGNVAIGSVAPGDVLYFNGVNWAATSPFTCSSLNTCSVNHLGDVQVTSPANGQVLAYSAGKWINTAPAGGGGFTCSDLNTCTLDDTADVHYPAPPTNGQGLVWSNSFASWIPNTLFQNFQIADGTTSQTIATGNVITFVGASDATVTVSATDTVTVEVDVCAALAGCNIGQLGNVVTTAPTSGQVLTYNGTNWVNLDPAGSGFVCTALAACSVANLGDVTVTSPSNGQVLTYSGGQWINAAPSGSGFSCGDLATCDAADLSDVHYPSAPTNGQGLVWSDSFAAWIPNTLFQNFQITDNTTNQTIASGNTIQFIGENDAIVTVSATDTVTIDVDVCATLGTCTLNSIGNVNAPAPLNGQVLTYNTSTSKWINATPPSGSFTIFDGASSQSVDDGDTLSLAGGGDTQISVGGGPSITITTNVCAALSGCDIEDIGNVAVTGPVSGHVLVYDGSNWVNQAPATSSFNCSQLSTCSISNLGDVDSSGVLTGQSLRWNGFNFVPFTIDTFGFTITDGSTTQTIADGNSITFTGGGDTTVTVSAVDTVMITTDVCAALAGCNIANLGDVSVSSPSNGQVLTYVSGTWVNQAPSGGGFSCTDLNTCSIDSLSDVDTSGASVGDVLEWDGSNWTPQTPAGGAFLCGQLATCNLNSMADVAYPSAPSNGQALVWSTAFANWIPNNVFSNFTITDGSTNQTIASGNTITFAAGGDLSVAVSATDTVTYTFNETVTNLTFNTLTNVLTYTNEAGNTVNHNIGLECSDLATCNISHLGNVSASGAATNQLLVYNGTNWVNQSFSCNWLNSCPINSLSNVNANPTNGQVLTWNGSQWVATTPSGGGGGSITVLDTACIDLTLAGSQLSANPIISPSREITTPFLETFENALVCTAEGLFVGCPVLVEATITQPHGFDSLRIPCGADEFMDVSIPAHYEVLRTDTGKLDTPAPGVSVGSNINMDLAYNQDEALLYYRDPSNEWQPTRTYSFISNMSHAGGGYQTLTHSLETEDVSVTIRNGVNVSYLNWRTNGPNSIQIESTGAATLRVIVTPHVSP